MYQEQNWGKPVYRIGEEGKWATLKDAFLIYRQQVSLIIDYEFQTNLPVFFALSIPFTYWEMQNYLNNLKYLVPESLSYQDEVIKQTKTRKNLHMITIQDKQLKDYKQKSGTGRCIILITSRVHPGEVSGSYCLMGMLDFILRPFSLQSQILRKMFTFVIVPMVNPEGVSQGNYRMDLYGQNLNRVYLDPHPSKHETVFVIKQKIEQLLKKKDRIIFHFDLHSHSCLKRSFIYGNAFDDIIQQTETQILCKLLDRNCKYFQESYSQFGQKHMKFKDKGQSMSKQGCARVVFRKMASITYSYTVESSIFSIEPKNYSSEKSEKKVKMNEEFKIQDKRLSCFGFSYDDFEDVTRKYSEQPNIIDQNKNLGTQIMISILDLMLKNPFSSLNEKDFDEIRKQIAFRILQNQERFKMLDTKAYHKSKFISHFAKNQFQSKFKDEWNWLASHEKFGKIQWPQGFQWFKNQNQVKIKRVSKLKTEVRENRIYNHQQKQVLNLKLFPQAISNRMKIKSEVEQLKQEFQKLPLIRKSLETKRLRTDEKEQCSDKKLQKTQHLKIGKNLIITNRSNILLTFLEEVGEKKEERIISKKRIVSLKMASINRHSAQKPLVNQKTNQNNTQPLESDFPGLKPSHSQGQLPISALQQQLKTNGEEGYEFEDNMILKKNLQIKRSRKELLNRKVSMLKRANETKKNANRSVLMNFPQFGQDFLITNAKRKLQKLKTRTDKGSNQERSTIQSNQQMRAKYSNQIECDRIIKLKTQTSVQ